jgi:hypothetical protein
LNFLTYAGFYYTFPVLAAVLLLQPRPWPERFKTLAAFGVPVIGLVLALHAVSQGGFDVSYLTWLHGYATTVNMGDFHAGWRFLWEYLSTISIGFCALGLVAWLTTLGDGFRQRSFRRDPAAMLAACAAGLYLWLVVNSDVLAVMVVYARILTPLFLIMMMLLADWLTVFRGWIPAGSRWERRHGQAQLGLTIVLALSFLPVLTSFLRLQYPQDQNWQFAQQSGVFLPERFLHSSNAPDGAIRAFQPDAKTLVLISRTVSTQRPQRLPVLDCARLHPERFGNATVYLLLNREYISPIEAVQVVDPGLLKRSEVLYERPHPLSFVPYQYEGYSEKERILLQQSGLRMFTLKNPCRS